MNKLGTKMVLLDLPLSSVRIELKFNTELIHKLFLHKKVI